MSEFAELLELMPLIERSVELDPRAVIRLRVDAQGASALVMLPFAVLVGRRIKATSTQELDAAYSAGELLAWLKGGAQAAQVPTARDREWRSGLPPTDGWQRIETVPDRVIRDLVRAGGSTLKQAAAREGSPDAQPRAEVIDVLLDLTVLTVEHGPHRVEVNLRLLSALMRMGFLARDSHIAVEVVGRWLRVVADFGTVYAERRGSGLAISSDRSASAQPRTHAAASGGS